MRTIAIANHKGGVGKTALCHHLGEALATDHGQRVLMVDLDPQGSLTGNLLAMLAKARALPMFWALEARQNAAKRDPNRTSP